jgi:hypothetical protein
MQITLEGLAGSGELWIDVMKIICGDTSKQCMIDLGCHHAPYTSRLGFRNRTYVDIQDRPLDDPNEQQYFIKWDAIAYLDICEEYFDVCIASDFIEHLTKEKGERLLDEMWKSSDKSIIFTPIGEYMITNDDHPDSHRSAWTPEMLPDWLSIVLPNFHPTLTVGAFFAANCSDEEKTRIYNEIKIKYAFYDKS